MKKTVIWSVCFLFLWLGVARAESGLKVTNEMIYQKLLEIEKKQAILEVQFREFKEATSKRFEELREDMNRRFDQMMTFLWILTGIFTTLTLGVIGFALWDRRTIIRRAKEEAVAEIEAEGRLRDLIRALRELAREDARLAQILRNYGLL